MTLYTLPSTFVEQRRNRHTNPNLAVDATGWGANPNDPSIVFTLTGEAEYPGEGALRVSNLPTGTGAFDVSTTVATSPGTVVTASFLIRRGAGENATVTPRIQWNDNSSVSGTSTVIASRDYERISVTGTAPAGVTNGKIRVVVTGAGPATVLLLRRGMYEFADTVLPYFDGSSESSAAVKYEWLGAVAGSASTMSIPNAASTLEPLMTLAPYTAVREARTVVHRLLDDYEQKFTWRAPTLPEGVFEFLFDSHGAAYAALNKLQARTAWALVDETDDGPIERWFMVAGGGIEMEQSREVENAYVVRVPYVEVDQL